MPFTVKETEQSRYYDPMHWSEVYEGLIVPAVEEVGLVPERDDQDTGSRFIGENILRIIEDAELVLCDLSSHNPNVFLELGWALRADRPFVLIKDDLTTYTFDLNQQYTFDYSHALQPTRLRKETKALADVLRLTLNDSERRYSLLRRMSISLSTIKSFRGDPQTEILLDIQRLLNRQQAGKIEELLLTDREDFPWPQLLRRSMAILKNVTDAMKEFEISSSRKAIVARLNEVATKFDAKHDVDIQFSLIDQDGVFIYHDWEDLIGRVVRYRGIEGYETYDEIRKYPHGAVAWVDRTSNVPRIPKARLNIALFSSVPGLDWKVIVEAHKEID